MPNLVVLDLRVNSFGLDATLFDALYSMTRLKKLSIDRPLFYELPIEYMFPLFERLDELEVEGFWSTRLAGPPLPSEARWALTRLRITSGENLSLLWFCPNLRRFEFCWLPNPTTPRLGKSTVDVLWLEMYHYLSDLNDLTTIELDFGYGPYQQPTLPTHPAFSRHNMSSDSQEYDSTVVTDKVPTEIILAVRAFLDGPSLLASDLGLASQLSKTVSLEWSSNEQLLKSLELDIKPIHGPISEALCGLLCHKRLSIDVPFYSPEFGRDSRWYNFIYFFTPVFARLEDLKLFGQSLKATVTEDMVEWKLKWFKTDSLVVEWPQECPELEVLEHARWLSYYLEKNDAWKMFLASYLHNLPKLTTVTIDGIKMEESEE
ncbi:hypothetical protein BGX24_000015 [Mortierella sp. AD032]|nr:hypothetical protein BGX24_000015 [Mortierella sp. AD032]